MPSRLRAQEWGLALPEDTVPNMKPTIGFRVLCDRKSKAVNLELNLLVI